MADILRDILATKQEEVARARLQRPLADLERRLGDASPPRGFFAAVTSSPHEVQIIAEVKKASPSAGVIRADFQPTVIAQAYQAGGAAALSILTDEQYFQGHLEYLVAARASVSLPVLRKEFIIDRYQLVEARVAGADAVLLIAECLPGDALAELHREAVALGLDVLVEIHDADQLDRALAAGTRLLGINNRDLCTFTTRLEHTLDLLPRIPKEIAVVSESGIRTHADLLRLGEAGARAVLVGESLMRQTDMTLALRALRGV